MNLLLLCALLAAPSPTVRLEAEAGALTGTETATNRAGASGGRYVTGFSGAGDKVAWTVRAPAGIYTVRIRYSSPKQPKGYVLNVNGVGLSGMFEPTDDGFAIAEGGRVELTEGENRVALENGWGYYDLDYVEFAPAPAPPAIVKPPKTLANPNASPRTRALYGLLIDRYGADTLSGQYGEADSDLVQRLSGKLPAILGGDFMDYSPSRRAYGADPKNESERLIAAAKQGAILTISWHWNAPKDLLDRMEKNERGEELNLRWYRGFYTNATTFDVAKAMADPNSEEYRLLVRDIDVIAEELKKFQRADVPVLWRPLHEAEGRWFWWGAKGPEPCKKLWNLMFDRMTRHHRLNNLIWVWNSAAESWYPGDDTVDVMSVDVYTDARDPMTNVWDPLLKRFNGRKPLALAELGGVADVERKWRFGVRWSYFVSWTGTLGPAKNTPEDVRRLYRSPRTITRDELPKW